MSGDYFLTIVKLIIKEKHFVLVLALVDFQEHPRIRECFRLSIFPSNRYIIIMILTYDRIAISEDK